MICRLGNFHIVCEDEQGLLVFARALNNDPLVIMGDEPTGDKKTAK